MKDINGIFRKIVRRGYFAFPHDTLIVGGSFNWKGSDFLSNSFIGDDIINGVGGKTRE